MANHLAIPGLFLYFFKLGLLILRKIHPLETARIGEHHVEESIFCETIMSVEPGAVAVDLFPNPATTDARLLWPLGEELKNVELTDLSGRVVSIPVHVIQANQMLLR